LNLLCCCDSDSATKTSDADDVHKEL